MDRVTREQAEQLYELGWWEEMTDEQIVGFQLFQDKLCMPWPLFHAAVGRALGRPVYTHEFAESAIGQLRAEFKGEAEPRTLEQIIELIPEEKRIVVLVDEGGDDG